MAIHTIELVNIGTIHIVAPKLLDRDYPYCDAEGNLLTESKKGEKGSGQKTVWLDKNGNEVPSSMLRKLINGVAVPRLSRTTKVSKVTVIDDTSVAYDFLETSHKCKVFTDSPKILETIKSGKGFAFKMSHGYGWKAVTAILFSHKGILSLWTGRGNYVQACEQQLTADKEIELEEPQMSQEEILALM